MKYKIKATSKKPKDFLSSLSSVKFKTITPTILDNILIHLHSQNKSISLPELKIHYQCSGINLEALFKKNIGISFADYQNIIFKTT